MGEREGEKRDRERKRERESGKDGKMERERKRERESGKDGKRERERDLQRKSLPYDSLHGFIFIFHLQYNTFQKNTNKSVMSIGIEREKERRAERGENKKRGEKIED